ncbi:MAG: PEP-CTERM sorting domain-containing protein [Edaphobacter sp.]
MRIFPLLTLVAVFAAPVALYATPITYTDSFIGTGSLGATSFTDQLVTLTGVGDTDNVYEYEPRILVNIVPTTVSIAGGATGTFTDPIRFLSNRDFSLVGVTDFAVQSGILFTTNDVFEPYELTTAIGPVTGSSSIRSGMSFATSSGAFTMTSVGDSTFTATLAPAAVPEPSSLVLLGTGALGVLGMMKRKLFTA